MSSQAGRKGDRSAEEEQAVQHIHSDHDSGVESPVRVQRRWNKVDEGDHGESRSEHDIVHGAGVAAESLGDHVTHEGEDEQRPDKLHEGIISIAGLQLQRGVDPCLPRMPAGLTGHPLKPC